ncbi:MAG: PIN domain-containing protein [Candidatus Tectomicrobia bacterium]|nr:PIN domain-containing protein [Candidatus Tectomicrobia bacterium]
MRLALCEVFRAKWSSKVHEEWIEAVLRNRPDLKREQLEHTRELMDAHGRDCLVEDFESLIDSLRLPDPTDRHVLAAAIRGRADIIVTRNIKDFPRERLDPYGIEAQLPDTFITHLLDLNAAAVVRAALEHRASLKNPPKSVAEYLHTLARQGLTQTVAELPAFASSL